MDAKNNTVMGSKRKAFHALEWIFLFPLAVSRILKNNNNSHRQIIVFLSWTIYICLALMLVTSLSSYISNHHNGLYVSLSYDTQTDAQSGDRLLGVRGNLPEGTRMIFRLTNDNKETWECEFVIGRWKTGSVSVKDDLSNPPDGKYVLTVEMLPPSEQPESVQSIIGKNGELLQGRYVTHVRSKEGSYKTVIFQMHEMVYRF